MKRYNSLNVLKNPCPCEVPSLCFVLKQTHLERSIKCVEKCSVKNPRADKHTSDTATDPQPTDSSWTPREYDDVAVLCYHVIHCRDVSPTRTSTESCGSAIIIGHCQAPIYERRLRVRRVWATHSLNDRCKFGRNLHQHYLLIWKSINHYLLWDGVVLAVDEETCI